MLDFIESVRLTDSAWKFSESGLQAYPHRVPVAHQIANGGGHKGSRSLRTRRIGLWRRAGGCGEIRALRAQIEHHAPACPGVVNSASANGRSFAHVSTVTVP